MCNFDAMRVSVEILKRKLSVTYVCHAKAMAKITTDYCNFIISDMRCAPLCICVTQNVPTCICERDVFCILYTFIVLIQCIDLIHVQKTKQNITGNSQTQTTHTHTPNLFGHIVQSHTAWQLRLSLANTWTADAVLCELIRNKYKSEHSDNITMDNETVGANC